VYESNYTVLKLVIYGLNQHIHSPPELTESNCEKGKHRMEKVQVGDWLFQPRELIEKALVRQHHPLSG
jgi:hypothetical protein